LNRYNFSRTLTILHPNDAIEIGGIGNIIEAWLLAQLFVLIESYASLNQTLAKVTAFGNKI